MDIINCDGQSHELSRNPHFSLLPDDDGGLEFLSFVSSFAKMMKSG